jgi:hypothetical protein
VPDTRAGRHHLNVALAKLVCVPEDVLMGDAPASDVREDLDVAMRVHGKPAGGREPVVVPNVERLDRSVDGVRGAIHSEVVARLEPAEVSGWQACMRAMSKHE